MYGFCTLHIRVRFRYALYTEYVFSHYRPGARENMEYIGESYIHASYIFRIRFTVLVYSLYWGTPHIRIGYALQRAKRAENIIREVGHIYISIYKSRLRRGAKRGSAILWLKLLAHLRHYIA